jgi:ribosomal protein L11 methylase PrmA
MLTLVAAPRADAVLLLSAGPGAALSPFGVGKTATATGSLTATDTSGGWTLTAKDLGTGAGKLVAGAAGCSGSDATLANPLQLSVTSSLAGFNSAGAISLNGGDQTVASATSQTLTGDTFTTNYTQAIPSTEKMLTGCGYTITVTYTLQ